MSSQIDKRIKAIKEQALGATGKQLLLLEGPDDVIAFRLLLDRQSPTWESHWALAAAGSKKAAQEMAQKEPDWLVLVDRDENSTAAQVAGALIAGGSNLVHLPRFCLESYLVDPTELWNALPAGQQARIAGGLGAFESALLANLADWRRHAALWHVINPKWSGLRARGFNTDVLDPQRVPDDEQLRQTLTSWSQFMQADTLFDEVQQRLSEMTGQPLQEFLHRRLYAKAFFPLVVVPVLNRFLGQASEADRRRQLFEHLPPPADLGTVWARLGLEMLL